MLNKEVCKRCMAVTPIETGLRIEPEYNPPMPWSEEDEERWSKGTIACPHWGKEYLIYSEGHWKCQYGMEHIVMNGIKVKETI